MNTYSKAEAISEMNRLGANGTPFVFLIDFEMKKIIITDQAKLDDSLLINIPGLLHEPESATEPRQHRWTMDPMEFSDYKTSYQHVMAEINLGNTFLLNLAHPTPLSYSGSLEDIYHSAKAKYKICLRDQFTTFSPETFVKITGGCIYTYPMKGTIDSTVPHALEVILADEKELAEHYTIVDLLRNDLSIISKEVEVVRFRYPDYINTADGGLIQISSEIKGRLPEGYKEEIGSLLFALLPAGSVSGAPKQKTLNIIQEAEGQDRGYYTGICGYFDGRNMDTGVMIRYVEATETGYQYRSGGGITFQSQLASEYKEMLQKVYLPTEVAAISQTSAANA